MIYISNPVDNVIYEIDPGSGDVRTVLQGGLVMPGSLAVIEENGQESLIVTGVFRPSLVDLASGNITPFSGPNQFQSAFTVDSRGTTLATAEYRTGIVKLLDRTSGEELEVLDGFQSPYDVRILPDGSLLVADFKGGIAHSCEIGSHARGCSGRFRGSFGSGCRSRWFCLRHGGRWRFCIPESPFLRESGPLWHPV